MKVPTEADPERGMRHSCASIQQHQSISHFVLQKSLESHLRAVRMMAGSWTEPEVRLVNPDWVAAFETMLSEGCWVREMVNAGAYKAVVLGLTGEEMVGGQFFLDLRQSA